MKKFFIADTHFGDCRIIRYENRPFESAEEMDQTLMANWNRCVRAEDLVYFLGDFGASQREAEVLDGLNGTKILVRGNHDTESNAYYRKAGFQEVYDLPVILDGFWILSHEPLYVNVNMPYANIFGHVHNSPLYKNYSPQHYCVCVERIGYSPISFEEIKGHINAFS